MLRIAPVNLYCNPKTLWFDAGELDVRAGDGVVVSTARGTEFGRAAADVFEADEAAVKKLRSPLKPVKRIATPEDEEQAAAMERKSAEALPVFKEMAAEANDDMRPVSVEYLFDGDKAVFYFEAEDRVDFRDLVRKLAARFHVRIDMRQIGVRDEARMVGGLGHCGQELCCKRLGGEFCPVSIRMAKEQDLSLNPQKISGVCGRLMCCLRYEYEAYKDFKSRAPKQNAQIETPAGIAKVVDLDVPREVVSLKVEGEKPVKVPLSAFEPPEEGATRPKAVGEEAWEEASAQAVLGAAGMGASSFATSQLTGQDKLADPTAVRRTGRGAQKSSRFGGGAGAAGGSGSKQTSRSGSSKTAAPGGTGGRKPRKRRSTKVGGESAAPEAAEQQKRRGAQGPSSHKQGAQKAQSSQKKRGGQPSGKKQQRAEGSKKAGRQASQNAQGAQAAKRGPQSPRPGQKSSGLRQKPQKQKQAASPRANAPAGGEGARQAPAGEGHRRARRRSHKTGSSAPQGAQGSQSSQGASGGRPPAAGGAADGAGAHGN